MPFLIKGEYMKKKNTSYFKKYSKHFKEEFKRHKIIKKNIPNITLCKIVYEEIDHTYYVKPNKMSKRLLKGKNIQFREIYTTTNHNASCRAKLTSIFFHCFIQGHFVEVVTDYDSLYVDIGESDEMYIDGYVNYSDKRFVLFEDSGFSDEYTELNDFLKGNITEELMFQYSLIIDKLEFYVELYKFIQDLHTILDKQKHITISQLCNIPALRKINEENETCIVLPTNN